MFDIAEKFCKEVPKPLKPFQQVTLDFCEELSKLLFDLPRNADLHALAFWLRKSHLEELKNHFENLFRLHIWHVPRGLAFHIAPGNIETMFVYSWILSLLVGNSNFVRLPTRDTPQRELLFQKLPALLNKFPLIAERTCLLNYGYDDAITALVSSYADVRIIWGGDETIQKIRSIPLKVRGQELVFADRFGFSVISVKSWFQLPPEERHHLLEGFYRDVYLFEQCGCSSTRALIWIGDAQEALKASDQFFQLLQTIVTGKGLQFPTSVVLQKKTHLAAQSMAGEIHQIHELSNELTKATVHALNATSRRHPGGGILFQAIYPNLAALAPSIELKDQTVTHFGFENQELLQFVETLNGQGIDRLVPIGQALSFSPFWDGYDLLQDFSKSVSIESASQSL